MGNFDDIVELAVGTQPTAKKSCFFGHILRAKEIVLWRHKQWRKKVVKMSSCEMSHHSKDDIFTTF